MKQAALAERVAMVGVRYDGSSSYLRGSADAPPMIREALWSDVGNPWSELGVDLSAAGLDDEGDLMPDPAASSREVRDAIEAGVRRILDSNRRPLVLGGDHSISYPVLRAMRSRHPKLGILHLDAHGDLYEVFQGDRFSHACPFARIMEEGLTDRLVQVGVRTINRHQREQAARYGVEMIEMKDWNGTQTLEFEQPVYLSFDLDVIEPGLAPGVSHREPGGLTIRQAIDIIHSFRGTLVGADFVEFNPLADATGLTASVSAKLVKELAARMFVEKT
jgi:arginase